MTSPHIKAHRLLALLLGIFIVVHFGVHLTALKSAPTHLTVLDRIDGFYKNWVIEPLLVMAIMTQIVIGFKLLKARWGQEGKGFWGWLQILSGGFLAFFLVAHCGAALTTRYIFGLDTNFYWAASTLNIDPLPYIFTPYYFLGVFSVFAHLAAAIHFGWEKRGRFAAPLIVIIGIITAVLLVSAFSGAFYEINLPSEYTKFFETYVP